ncbi:MAG: hypothetical protein KDC57_05095 [Saprospiraceae bacterium]|nr:hypothetical protein [Saprospiraceae bacterium]
MKKIFICMKIKMDGHLRPTICQSTSLSNDMNQRYTTKLDQVRYGGPDIM